MLELIGEWTGKVIVVALRVGGGLSAHRTTTLEGKLLKVGESGVLLELPKEQTFVPISAILHISLSETR